MKLSNATYDVLQRVMRLIIPFVVFLMTLGDIWGLDWMPAVTATISALGVFLGAALEISNKNYKKDMIAIDDMLEEENP